jgi:hypothetical protein
MGRAEADIVLGGGVFRVVGWLSEYMMRLVMARRKRNVRI